MTGCAQGAPKVRPGAVGEPRPHAPLYRAWAQAHPQTGPTNHAHAQSKEPDEPKI